MVSKKFEEGHEYYLENGKVIMTEKYHLERGYCCGNNCRHCVYEPRAVRGNTNISKEFLKKEDKNLDDKV